MEIIKNENIASFTKESKEFSGILDITSCIASYIKVPDVFIQKNMHFSNLNLHIRLEQKIAKKMLNSKRMLKISLSTIFKSV